MTPSSTDHLPYPLSALPAHEAPPGVAVAGGIAEDLTLTEATELLDWLEGHGIRAQEVQLNELGRMTIRWGQPD
jgi:hypothetical protein